MKACLLLLAIPFGLLLTCLSVHYEHRNDNKCSKCGNRASKVSTTGMFIRGDNYVCSCGNKWRILEDY